MSESVADGALRAAQALVWASAPVLLVQGRGVRRRTPVLPPARGVRGEAPGPGSGAEDGAAPAAAPGPDGAATGEAGARGPLRLLVLGDSTAAGVGAATQREALAGHLAAGLAGEIGRKVAWRVTARSGADVRAVAAELLPAAAEPDAVDTVGGSAGRNGEGSGGAPPRPDLVVVVVGVNDAKGMTGRRAFRSGVTALAVGVRERWRAPAVFGAVPRMDLFPALPWPLRPLLGLRSRYLDAAMRDALSGQPGAVYAPFPGDAVGGPGFFAADGFHPGAEGYRSWARRLVPVCLGALSAPVPDPTGTGLL